MSVLTIAPYFPFRRIKIVNQIVLEVPCGAQIQIQPDKCFHPILPLLWTKSHRRSQLDREQGPGFELGCHTLSGSI